MPTELPEGYSQASQKENPEKAVQDTSPKARRHGFWNSLKSFSKTIGRGISGCLKSYKTEVDVFNKILQIGALFVAGYWTWSLWNRTTAPGLEAKLNVQSEARWSTTPDDDLCRASLYIEIKNDGQRSLEVEGVTLTAWIIDLKAFTPPSAIQPTFIEPQFVREHGKSVKVPVPDEPIDFDLLGHYPPGYSHHSAASVIFKKSPDALFVFDAAVTAHESRGLFPFTEGALVPGDAWSLDQICKTPKEK